MCVTSVATTNNTPSSKMRGSKKLNRRNKQLIDVVYTATMPSLTSTSPLQWNQDIQLTMKAVLPTLPCFECLQQQYEWKFFLGLSTTCLADHPEIYDRTGNTSVMQTSSGQMLISVYGEDGDEIMITDNSRCQTYMHSYFNAHTTHFETCGWFKK